MNKDNIFDLIIILIVIGCIVFYNIMDAGAMQGLLAVFLIILAILIIFCVLILKIYLDKREENKSKEDITIRKTKFIIPTILITVPIYLITSVMLSLITFELYNSLIFYINNIIITVLIIWLLYKLLNKDKNKKNESAIIINNM